MTDLPTIGDHRWEGYNPNDLVEVVNQVKSGPGATAMNPAIDALKSAIQAVADMDATLRRQLAELGIAWESTAGQQAQASVTQSADYARQADSLLTTSLQAVDMQGSSHSHVKNSLPDANALSYDRNYKNGFSDGVQHFFGYETDHDKQVKAANSAKAVVVQQMNAYTDNSRTNLAAYQPLPAPPVINLEGAPVSGPSGGGSVAGPTLGQPGYVPLGGAGGSGVGIGGGGGAGPGGPVGGPPGAGAPGGGTPGGGPSGGLGPGGRVGIGPNPGAPGGPFSGPPPGRVSVGGGFNLASEAGLVLGAGAGIGAGAAALAEKRGGLGRGARGPAGGVPGSPEGSAPSGGGQGPGERGKGPGGTLGIGAQEEGAAARPGRSAPGGTAARGSSAMMQPAAVTKGEDEEDKEHIRKYAVESSEVFDDERLVVPTVIGDTGPAQEEPRQEQQQRGADPQ